MAAGTRIDSPGVCAYCPLDGWLQVVPEWAQGYVTGEYVGDSTYGADHPTVINLGFKPRAIVIAGNNVSPATQSFVWVCDQMLGSVVMAASSPIISSCTLRWLETGISFFNTENEFNQLNNKPTVYHYIAWR